MSVSDLTPMPGEERKINWQELYVLVNHWKSDLEFYKDDIRFLQQLIEKYIIWITKKENMDRVAGIRKKEHDLALNCDKLHKNMNEHLGLIANFMDGKATIAKTEFLILHGKLEESLSGFVKDFRESRKEVFKVTEYVMDSEELQNILDS
ncbi:hypothetical protein [Muriicola soli]|uniref:Uncharacterized protein n=1 Tax=Muriicola soli TaxID=2507538 RepID=A0A411E7F5_9FLAO|nr:hypothetical protein [Muriicola soli]QBA63635.1 hypothetical protein EQY75_03170 [Muriicola soli]